VCTAITQRRARKFLISRPFPQASASRNKSSDLTLRSRSAVEVIAMADDKTKRGPADRARINSNEDYELEYRAKEWGVSKERIREAVQAVGPMVDDVKRHLGV
jgi:hypothetical protein